MRSPSHYARHFAAASIVLAAFLLFAGIWSFGIWDPWELSAADTARSLLEGDAAALRTPPLGSRLVALGFQLGGVHEWSGRLPIAVMGLLTVAVAMWLVARLSDLRGGIYAALITVSTPLLLLNSRAMMGAAPGFAAQALVFLTAASLAFRPDTTLVKGAAARAAWAVGLAASIALSVAASGYLLGALPPLGAVAAVVVARGGLARASFDADRPRAAVGLGLVILAVGSALIVARAVAANGESYSPLIGGAPPGLGSVPSFEVVLEQIFHSFAPWTALLPIALGRALVGLHENGEDEPRDSEEALRLALPLWAIFGSCAQTVFLSRFGASTFLPVVALAASVALFLRDVERSGRGSWAAGVVALLLSVLLLRDYRGYPVSSVEALGLAEMTWPEIFNPWVGWAALLGAFGAVAMLVLSTDREESFETLRGDAHLDGVSWAANLPRGVATTLGVVTLGWPRRLVATQWARGLKFRVWLMVFALLGVTILVFGVMCLGASQERSFAVLRTVAIVSGVVGGLALFGALLARAGIGRRLPVRVLWVLTLLALAVAISCGILSVDGLSSVVLRVGRYLLLALVGIYFAILAGRGVRYGFQGLGRFGVPTLLLVGVIFGGYVSFRFQPQLSAHFSPSDVYDAYNEHAREGEVLGEYHVSGRAAAYYARGPVEEIRDQNAVLTFLARPDRVWLAFRADDLATLNRAWRQRSGHHLFVVNADSASVLLATNQPVDGMQDQNALANAILDEAPQVQFPVGADFDRRVELIGYDLALPGNGRTVGPGQSFVITWYWRVLAPIGGSYQIFLHVDGMGQRLNGDHEPVDGHYPVRLWDEGDIVVDRQPLSVPANYPPGTYTFFIGFYSGDDRLEIVRGPEDDVNRARAGTLQVR